MVIAPGQLLEEGWVPTRSAKPNQSNRSHSPDPRAGDRPSSRTIIYTDGACSGNPGPGGWAWVIPGGRYRSGAERHTTNQRMELAAALDAVRTVEGALEIVSDSTYVVNCFRQRWWEGWLSRGWVNSKKQPVANRDLWEPLVEIYRARSITFRWVKGHAGNKWNDAADRLAVEASLTQRGTDGEGPPPAEPIASARRDGSHRQGRPERPHSKPPEKDLPPGHTVVYTDGDTPGHSGPGGWAWMVPGRRYRSGAEERTTTRRMELTAALDAVRELEGALEVVSDSTYVVNCFRNRWWEAWLRRDWANSKGKPVANRDLWEPLIEMYRARPIGFRLAGPEDDQWTGATGWLATEAARTQQGARGEVPQPPAW